MRPFIRRRFRIFRPVCVFNRAMNPADRFRLSVDGL